MVKPIVRSLPVFAARPFTGTILRGSRPLLENPPDVPGTGAATTPAAVPTGVSPAVIASTHLRDEVSKIIREELPGPVADAFEKARAASLEKVSKLDERLNKLDDDFRRMYQSSLGNPKPGQGLVERDLIMRPTESVDEFIERLGVASNRIMGGGAMPSGGRRMGGGAGRGLEGVRDQRGVQFARQLRAYAVAARENGWREGDLSDAAADVALKRFGDKFVADAIKEAAELSKKAKASGTEEGERSRSERSLSTTTIGSGASFVTTDIASFFMDYLFAKVIAFALGTMSITMRNEMKIPFIDGTVTAGFRGEAAGPNASQPTDNQMMFSRKIVSALCAATNEWLNEADYGPDVFIRNHLARAISTHVDLRFFRGRGTANEVRGADYWIDNAGQAFDRTRDAGSGKATYKTILRDTLEAFRIIASNNIDLTRGSPGYAMQNETFYALMRLLSGSALELRPFADELRGGTLNGAGVQVTTQFPTNQAGDGVGDGTNNKTDLYVADWSTAAVAQNGGIELKAMDGAAYKDNVGGTQLAFVNNETVFRADWKLDVAFLQRGKEAVKIKSNDWHVTF
jgi:HK97 family phage major capsid protein